DAVYRPRCPDCPGRRLCHGRRQMAKVEAMDSPLLCVDRAIRDRLLAEIRIDPMGTIPAGCRPHPDWAVIARAIRPIAHYAAAAGAISLVAAHAAADHHHGGRDE